MMVHYLTIYQYTVIEASVLANNMTSEAHDSGAILFKHTGTPIQCK